MVKKLLAAGGVGALGVAGVLALRRGANWGATPEEVLAPLSGDELILEPAETSTLAVDIAAPADEVWRWLVQIGQDRGGLYSYLWLENLIGLDMHNADEIREEWQRLAVGDRVVLVREGWPLLPAGYALPVARLDPGYALVLHQQPPAHPWDAVWSFVIEPRGEDRCRLFSRTRTQPPDGVMQRLATRALSPIALLMIRRMLLGIKDRAEWNAHRPIPVIA